uniref:Uncharacterized protein n=1 Tax=Arundo donax TaxID=35708 RepID=A0A0A8YM47_ARUDO
MFYLLTLSTCPLMIYILSCGELPHSFA